MYFKTLIAVAAIFTITSCSSAPKGPFNETEFNSNIKTYADSHVDVSSGGILDESKKMIVPNFKVYFQTQAKGSAESGNFLTTNNARTSGKLNLAVDPKVLQEITDQAYAQFVEDMKSLGYTVIGPEELANQYPDFKEYVASDNMKTSPQNIDGQFMVYAPTGWKIELPGFEVGLNQTGLFKSAFRQNLMKIVYNATNKLDAISMEPVFIVGFGSIDGKITHTTASVQANQDISVLEGSKYIYKEGSSVGHVMMEKKLNSGIPYGKIIRADTAGDTTRAYFSAFGYNMLGKGENKSATWLIEADGSKFKTEANKMLKASQALFKNKIKEEL